MSDQPNAHCMGVLFALLLIPLSREVQAFEVNQNCYSCTTLDADRLLREVHDPSWRAWLEQIRFVPRSRHCADPFQTVSALRHGVRSVACDGGLCLKLWFREGESMEGQVWRSCVPRAKSSLRADCTRIESSQGRLEVCTCEGTLCNNAIGRQWTGWSVAQMAFLCFLFMFPFLNNHLT